MIRCPHCNKEIESARELGMFEGFVLPNLIPVTFVVGAFIVWLVPLDIKNGYAAEYDIVLVLIFMLLYLAYLIAYKYGKVKGRFVFYGREV